MPISQGSHKNVFSEKEPECEVSEGPGLELIIIRTQLLSHHLQNIYRLRHF